MDDTPPFEVDEEAVRVAVEMASLLNLNLVSELHVMRKQYLDGSIPTGFQRTAMVGLAGSIPFQVPELGVDRELRIRQLSLEEDSCREITDVGHRVTFRTDRLGTPLTEAVTEPDLRTPLQLQAAGRLLARVARATGKVCRGSGAARQDVNVSVAGGRRVEIKGVDNHRGLPALVHNEAFRQLNLLRIMHELGHRGVTHDRLTVPDNGRLWETSRLVVNAGSALGGCDFAPIQDALARGEIVCAVRIPGFGGLLTRRTQPGVTFARELADRVRVIACPVHRPFMIHSDLGDYGLDPRQWRNLSKQLGAEQEDAIVVVWGREADMETAAREVLIRAQDALKGVPAETRQAFPDATNGFERILPGPDRMYPDTDTPPLPISDTLVTEVRSQLGETPWAREGRYVALDLSHQDARRLADAPWADLFDALAPPKGEVARRIAHALAKRLPFHLRCGVIDRMPESDRMESLVRALDAGDVRPEATDRIIDAIVRRPDVPPGSLLEQYRRKRKDEAEFEEALEAVTSAASRMVGRSADTLMRWGMGEIMPRFLGRLDPKIVEQRLRETIG
jgi:glutamyl-tRNA(Gln) amidotransferase subunit E